jgi:hypothetical protein
MDYHSKSQLRLVEEDIIRRVVEYLAKDGLSAHDITKAMVKVAVVDLDVLSNVLQDFEFESIEPARTQAITEQRALSLGEQIVGLIHEHTPTFGNWTFSRQDLSQQKS